MSFRWQKKYKPERRVGDLRTVTRFLFFPKCLDDEYRWLGFERIDQVCYEGWSGGGGIGPLCRVLRWRDLSWGADA